MTIAYQSITAKLVPFNSHGYLLVRAKMGYPTASQFSFFSGCQKLSSLPGCDAADAGWPDLRRRERLKARTGATADGRFDDEFGNKKLDRF